MNSFVGCFAGIDAGAGKVDDHDAVLLHDSHQHEHADKSIERSFLSEEKECQQASYQSRRQRRKHRQGMHITFVENCQDHVHYKHCEGHQDRQAGDGVAEGLRFALQFSANG